MLQLHKKKLLLVGGYLVFNGFVMAICYGVLARITSTLSQLELGMGEVISHLVAALLPGPF